MKLLLKVIILTAACVVLFKSCSPYLGMENQLVGYPAPDFTQITLNSEEVNMTRLRNGKPAVIFFWATWCPHCRVQLRELTERRAEIESDGIKIILVDVGESAKKVENYMKINNIPFDTYLDHNEDLIRDYRIIGVPTFIFINREGIIVAVENVLPEHYKKLLLSRVTS